MRKNFDWKIGYSSDSYGDFWFEGLKDGIYDLQIKKGKKKKAFKKIDATSEDINLGDTPIPL